MLLKCLYCRRQKAIPLSALDSSEGPLCCSHCRCLITCVTIAEWRDWVEAQVERKRRLQETGLLRTRKQAVQQSDRDIDADGLAAELAACIICCPRHRTLWRKGVEEGGNNRGRDLQTAWTGIAKPLEVKYTAHFSATTGYLLIRPPTQAGWQMRQEFVDDCYYLLVNGGKDGYELRGWIDRGGFLQRKVIDPVGRTTCQLECWGVHWLHLYRMKTLPLPCKRSYVT
jgi:hypothetical protein